MLSVLNRCLITVLILFGLISLASAQLGASTINPGSGWTFYLDAISTGGGTCVSGSSTCTIGPDNLPNTQAGGVLVAFIKDGNGSGDTITGVCTGSGCTPSLSNGWVHCSNCAAHTGTLAVDAAYLLNAPGGQTSITATRSSTTGFFQVEVFELIPPPGFTATFDVSGSVSHSSCTNCSAVGLTTTATDAVVQFQGGGNVPTGITAWSSPYITDTHGNGIYLNAPSGAIAAPTMATTSANLAFAALAFSSTLGSFTPPAQQFSLVHFTFFGNTSGGISCSPTCGLSVPTTSAGNLVYIQAGTITGTHIQSVTDGGGSTWVVSNCPSITQTGSPGANINVSCAYTLSAKPATTINVTMSGSANTGLTVSEISTTSGTFSVDTSSSAQRSGAFNPAGPTLTLTGTNDVIFQALTAFGGVSGVTLYPQPYINGQSVDFFNNEAAAAMLLNTTNGAGPQWGNGTGDPTAVTSIAFMAVGGSSAPNPPSGLAVIVQ